MKPGDKVRCVDASGTYLRHGGEYPLVAVDGEWYTVRDGGCLVDVKGHRFEPVSATKGQAPEADAEDWNTRFACYFRGEMTYQELHGLPPAPQGARTSAAPDRHHEHVQPPAVAPERDVARDAQPSQEAMAQAEYLVLHGDYVGTTRALVAAALQKLMDERDINGGRVDMLIADLVKTEKRADAAEKDAAEQRQLKCIALERAEAAEAKATLNIQSRAEAIERAEAAEKDAQQLQTRLNIQIRVAEEVLAQRDAAHARAEAAEKQRDAYRRGQEDLNTAMLGYMGERDAALASKAELVREVREWYIADPPTSLFDILDRHASDAEHPDTVRLRELVARVKKHATHWVAARILDEYEAKS